MIVFLMVLISSRGSKSQNQCIYGVMGRKDVTFMHVKIMVIHETRESFFATPHHARTVGKHLLWTVCGFSLFYQAQDKLHITVADSGGVRGVHLHPPLAASNVFLRT